MSGHFSFFLLMIVAIVLLTSLANKIKVAYPVLLVLMGISFSFIPGMPVINIRPELIFTVVLPPMLYGAAWSISWKELWRWRRIIGSFAFGVVFVTAVSVAFIADWCIPGFSLALGFLLGGVVSPPDSVSAGAILKFVKVPRRMSSVLEGESLLNDASSLIIFRFAMIAVITGRFIWHAALLDFSWMLAGGVSIGLAVGWVFMKAHRVLKTDINGDIALTLVAPYVMYLLAEALHSSGVIAVVSGGLFLSSKRYVFLSSHTRLRGGNVWESLLFVLNGFVFMLIGLDLPEIVGALGPESVSVSAAVGYGLVITAVLIGSRILFSFMAVLITLLASRFIKVADARNPGYKTPIVFGWTGMRGVVSLAAALSIPLEVSKGVPFPQRNLVIFITFFVVLATLLVQGLTLPWLIRKVKLTDPEDYLPDEKAELVILQGLSRLTRDYLATDHPGKMSEHPELRNLSHDPAEKGGVGGHRKLSPEARRVYIDLLRDQRAWLLKENRGNDMLDEDIVRKFLMTIDIEEARASVG